MKRRQSVDSAGGRCTGHRPTSFVFSSQSDHCALSPPTPRLPVVHRGPSPKQWQRAWCNNPAHRPPKSAPADHLVVELWGGSGGIGHYPCHSIDKIAPAPLRISSNPAHQPKHIGHRNCFANIAGQPAR